MRGKKKKKKKKKSRSGKLRSYPELLHEMDRERDELRKDLAESRARYETLIGDLQSGCARLERERDASAAARVAASTELSVLRKDLVTSTAEARVHNDTLVTQLADTTTARDAAKEHAARLAAELGKLQSEHNVLVSTAGTDSCIYRYIFLLHAQ
jgi:chromosome segregation ATPase